MRSSSKEGSYLRLVDFVSLNSRPRAIRKKKKKAKGECWPLTKLMGQVQDYLATRKNFSRFDPRALAVFPHPLAALVSTLQQHLVQKKSPPSRTLQQAYA